MLKTVMYFVVALVLASCTQNPSNTMANNVPPPVGSGQAEITASCGFGFTRCTGQYGDACYQQAQGSSCTNGKVCSFGYKFCLSGGQAACCPV